MGIQEDLMGIGVLSIGYEAEGGSHAPRKPDYFRVPTGNETGKTASLSSLGGIIMLNLAYCLKKNNICIVIWKQLFNFALSNNMKEELEEKPVFRLILSVEADSFLQSIPEKAREKVRYNIRRIQKGEQNKELFKKLDEKRFGSSEHYSIK